MQQQLLLGQNNKHHISLLLMLKTVVYLNLTKYNEIIWEKFNCFFILLISVGSLNKFLETCCPESNLIGFLNPQYL